MRKYIAAVSGGPDSMAMLFRYKNKIRAICHVNYHDREDTDNDELLLKKYAKELNINIHVFDTKKDDVSKYTHINNPQDYYRKIRYDFFTIIANKYNIKKCIVAHNKDDFIETANMQMNKNKKVIFYGIKKKSLYKDICIYRPLINIWKEDLLNYCLKKKIPIAIDYSNFSNKYQRNVIRKEFEKQTKFKKEIFFWNVKFINFKNKFKYLFLNYYFLNWKKTEFSIKYIQKHKKRYRYELWYLFLCSNNIKASQNKIGDIEKFVSNFKGTNKKYRLKNNVYLTIKNKKVVISK